MPGRLQAFSTEEFQARLHKTQGVMAELGLDMLLLHAPENIYYLTGYQTSGYFAYQMLAVTADAAEPTILVRYLERGNIDEYSWLSHDETWREGDDVIQRSIEVIRKLGGDDARIGIELGSWFLTAAVADQLRERLPRATFIDATLLVDRVRTVKSPQELAYIRKAGSIAETEVRIAVARMRDGATEAQVAAAVFQAGISAGCEYTGLPHHIMSGLRYNVCHANWTDKPIVPGELILIELYGCVQRYHATQMRTISIGKPNDDAADAARLVVEAQDAALAALKPGVSSKFVDSLVRGPIRRIRPDYFNRSGYSTGIGFPPRTAEWDALDFNETSDWKVQEGMAFHMLALAKGFGISETVIITKDGAERVTSENERSLIIL
jgi:Xaa-Pro dipeptidase